MNTATIAKPQNPSPSNSKMNESSLVSNLLSDDDILPVTYNREEYEEQKELEQENNDPPNEIDVDEAFDSVPYEYPNRDNKDGR